MQTLLWAMWVDEQLVFPETNSKRNLIYLVMLPVLLLPAHFSKDFQTHWLNFNEVAKEKLFCRYVIISPSSWKLQAGQRERPKLAPTREKASAPLLPHFISPADQQNLTQKQCAASWFASSYRMRRVPEESGAWDCKGCRVGQSGMDTPRSTRLDKLPCFYCPVVRSLCNKPEVLHSHFISRTSEPSDIKGLPKTNHRHWLGLIYLLICLFARVFLLLSLSGK